ncbi:MAG: DUF6448 family protein [Nitrososphaeria archaeon]|jgi:hypothetical protein
MPPHCDTMDGPVIKAAKKALETGNISFILPWVPKKAEEELERAFTRTLYVGTLSKEAEELADYWFFETAVRLHRKGEGAPYTGLKPAGLDEGPVIPKAEKAIEQENAKELIELLSNSIKEELQKKLTHTVSLKNYKEDDIDAAREYVEAMLDFTLYSNKLYNFIKGSEGHEVEGYEHKSEDRTR